MAGFPIDAVEIDRRFDHHPPSAETAMIHVEARGAYKSLAATLIGLPECREKSLAFTALEESLFWANAAIARESAPSTRVERLSRD